MDQCNLLTCILIFVDVTSKFCLTTTIGPVSNEGTVDPVNNEENPNPKNGDTKKHFSFDLSHVLTKVDGISLKIDGLIDLGPKWNFEYTFVPYDTNTNIGRQGPEIENGSENDATTTTPATFVDTERVTTKKKSRHKMQTGKVTEKSETSPEKHTEKKKQKHHKTSSEKWDKQPVTPQISPDKREENPRNPSEKSQKHSKGRSHKRHKLASHIAIPPSNREQSSEEKATTIKVMPKSSGTTPDYIYKHADNKSLILRSPHKVQEDTRLRDFTVHVYKQALRIFEELKKKVNDTKSSKQVDQLIRDYREKFAEFVNETQYVMVKTRLGTQKVILNTMESSNMILKKLIDHLMVDTVKKTVLRTEIKGVAGLLQAQLQKEMEVEYKHICSKFGICRSEYVFSNFLADVIGEIIKVNNKKLQIASDSLTEVIKEQHLKNHLQTKVEKRFREDIGYVEKMNPEQIRAVLQILRGILVNKYKPLPIMGSLEPKVMNRSLVVLDLIDLFDEKIQPNEENKLAWTDIKASYRDWADGNREDVLEIMDAFVRHFMKSGLEKFDAQTTKLLNDKLKLLYDMKRSDFYAV